MPEISWIHNVFGFRNKIQNISDHPVIFFFGNWAILKRNSYYWDTVYKTQHKTPRIEVIARKI